MKHLNREDVADILNRYLQGKATPDEARIVQRWFESLGTDVHLYVEADAREAIKSRIIDRIVSQSVTEIPLSHSDADPAKRAPIKRGAVRYEDFSFFRSYRKMAAAAIAIMAVCATIWLLLIRIENRTPSEGNGYTEVFSEVVNEDLQVKDVLLDDGSTVKLQPHSTLRFNAVRTAPKRIVHLTGEAYFEVSHDKFRPFIVNAGATRTRVLGTSFTIRAPGPTMDVSVTVRTGTVAVSKETDAKISDADTSEVVLTPNQKVVYHRDLDTFSTSIVEMPVLLPEHVNRESMQFDDESVAAVLEKLESAYGVHVEFDRRVLTNCKVTVRFTTEGLFERLKIVARALGASYEREGTQIRFIANGC